ncbi:MAG TPA: type II toxin-antitoxin system VapC family toxin [Asticcacaulis sp.]|nr:type II toxin-antitoxin system VapC family toxin [Asticcacaulis sp.]
MIVLDTNVVSELMKTAPDPRVQDWLMSLDAVRLTTTAVTVTEIEYGLQRLPEGQRKTALQERFAAFAEAMAVLPLDDGSARRAGQLRAMREVAGKPTTASDMMIAGIAAVADAILATRNHKDFDGLPLRIVNPWLG